MKRTIKNLFPAPTDSRTGGARLGARMLPAPTHLRRLFVALVALLSMTAQTAWADGTLTGEGTESNPYQIGNATDWDTFAGWINDGTNADKYYKLTADIGTTENPVTTMVGSRYNRFKGTFDGGGHTLTIQYGTADARKGDMFVAPFSYPENATIKNLHVAGYIYASHVYIAGIASQICGNSKILNCRCSVIFDSTTSGVSGIANVYNGYSLPSGDVVIANCIFDGEFRYNGDGENRAWSGLTDNCISVFKISNSLFAPTYMNLAKTTYTTTIGSCDDPGSNIIDNCYYTESLRIVQGNDASGMSAAELAAALGPMWEVRDNKALPIYNTNHLSGATVTGLGAFYEYTGSEITSASGYTLTDLEGNTLTQNTDYEVSLTCNGSPVDKVQTAGDYTITFTGKGAYSGTKEVTFKVLTYPEGLAMDNDYAPGDDAFFYVNLPKTENRTINLNGQTGGFTFKVYDDGGKSGNYSNGCTGTLVLTAPSGYRLQVTGSAPINYIQDYLCIYDGTDTSSPILFTQEDKDYNRTDNIKVLTSSSQNLTFFLHSDSQLNNKGIDLTVRLIDVNSANGINIINPQTGGEVSSSPVSAKVNEVITLTAAPANDYMLESISVKDSQNNNIKYDGGEWYSNNTATFTMPGSPVTVTSSFTTKKSIDDDLFINMPTEAVVNATIPAGVTSFKLYDDGGKWGNYSRVCDGTLILTAPEGYKIKLSGDIRTYAISDLALNVYDGTEALDEKILIKDLRSLEDKKKVIFEPVFSTSNTMRIRFQNNSSPENTFEGLFLYVELIDGNQSFDVTINNADEYGHILSDKATAKTSETVTLTATADDGYIVSDISVTDANSQPISVKSGLWYEFLNEGKATFIMPNSDVAVTSTFTNNKTAEGGLYINMERDGLINLAIPTGIRSFKVYDSGGVNGNYPKNCRSTLVLTAPAGYKLKLTGTVTTDVNHDQLTVYDGLEEDDNNTLLSSKKSSNDGIPSDIGTITSTGSSMRLYFWTNSDDYCYSGLDLKVEVVGSDEKHQIVLSNTAGGSVSADVSEAAIDQTVGLTLVPDNETYLPTKLDITSSDPVILEWAGSFSNTATFTMPFADVTVTPEFTNTWTAEGGLFAIVPSSGDASMTIPAGVKSFKIYDHGGPTGNYGKRIEGSLTLTAPAGYKHQLSGNIATEHENDYLTVRDVTANSVLCDKISSATNGQSSAISTVISSGETISLTFRSDREDQYAGLDLTSTLLPVSYAITYNGLEGATFSTRKNNYTIESQDITLDAPAKKGYTFAGWYDNGDYTGTAIAIITAGSTGDKTFYAKWTLDTYNITYSGVEGATFSTDKNSYTVESEDITLDAPAKDGYTFAGWYDNARFEGNAITTISKGSTGHKTFYAKWAPDTYNITYSGVEGATFSTDKNSYTIESKDITLDAPTKNGYTFEGWYDNAELTGNAITTISKGSTGHKTFYAKWTPVTYHIYYVIFEEGVTFTTDKNSYTIESEDIILDAPTKNANTFEGWYDNARFEGNAITTIRKGSTGDKTFYAMWKNIFRSVIIEDNGTTKSATLYDYNTVYIPTAVEVDHVTIGRTFESGKASTVYLPFSIAAANVSGGKFYTFTGVDETETPWKVNYEEVTGDIQASTPYIFLPDGKNDGKIVVNNGSDKISICTANPHTTTQGQWEFIGTYDLIKWLSDNSRADEIGLVYGFAAKDLTVGTTNYEVGQFVKIGSGAFIPPMRAYLKRSATAGARALSRGNAESLPETMVVVLRGANGETTSVIELKNGKMEELNSFDSWYSLDGSKLSGKPTKKGLYINNGKKVVIK